MHITYFNKYFWNIVEFFAYLSKTAWNRKVIIIINKGGTLRKFLLRPINNPYKRTTQFLPLVIKESGVPVALP